MTSYVCTYIFIYNHFVYTACIIHKILDYYVQHTYLISCYVNTYVQLFSIAITRLITVTNIRYLGHYFIYDSATITVITQSTYVQLIF